MTWVHSCSTQKIFARLMIPKLFVNLIWHNNYLFILFQLIIIMAETYTRIITISIASSVVIWHCEIDNLGMISAMTQLSIKSNIMFSGHLIQILLPHHCFYWWITQLFFKCITKRSLLITIHTYWWPIMFEIHCWCFWVLRFNINCGCVEMTLSVETSINWIISFCFWATISTLSHRTLKLNVIFAVHIFDPIDL